MSTAKTFRILADQLLTYFNNFPDPDLKTAEAKLNFS